LVATNIALLLTTAGNSLVKIFENPHLRLTRAVWRARVSPLFVIPTRNTLSKGNQQRQSTLPDRSNAHTHVLGLGRALHNAACLHSNLQVAVAKGLNSWHCKKRYIKLIVQVHAT